MSHKGLQKSGFTLIELVMAIVIISVAVMGTLLTFSSTVRKSADPLIFQQSNGVAKSYLEEILAKEFPLSVPCGSPPAGGRKDYANVCDYDGLVDTGAKDQLGQVLVGLGDYTITVSIDTTTASLGGLTPGTEVVRVDVRVSHAAITDILLSGYRTAY